MTAKDYPVSFPYGATTYPYSPASPHKGDDHAMPDNTKIIVNGTLIGLSGHSGEGVTGPHLHIGKYINGVAVPPDGQGFYLTMPATVYDTGTTLRDGHYVRLRDGNGIIWLYDHMMDNTIVKAGDIIGGEVMTEQEVQALALEMVNHELDGPSVGALVGKDWHTVFYTMAAWQEHRDYRDKITKAFATLDNPNDAQKKLNEIKNLIG